MRHHSRQQRRAAERRAAKQARQVDPDDCGCPVCRAMASGASDAEVMAAFFDLATRPGAFVVSSWDDEPDDDDDDDEDRRRRARFDA